MSPTKTTWITGSIRWAYASSLVVAALVMAVSLIGLLGTSTYPTAQMQRHFQAVDLANLVTLVPLLLASMIFARRGVACWPACSAGSAPCSLLPTDSSPT